MSGKIILLSSIIIGTMAVYFGSLNDKQENIYEIIEKTEKDIKYPQINFLNENDSKKEEKINALVRNELYGPYQFLSDPELAVSISYEVTYNDKNYLSICYHGSYMDQLGYAGDVGYAVTIDLNHGTIAELEDILP